MHKMISREFIFAGLNTIIYEYLLKQNGHVHVYL